VIDACRDIFTAQFYPAAPFRGEVQGARARSGNREVTEEAGAKSKRL